MVNINIHIPEELHHKVKLEATLKGITIKEYITKTLEKRTKKDTGGFK